MKAFLNKSKAKPTTQSLCQVNKVSENRVPGPEKDPSGTDVQAVPIEEQPSKSGVRDAPELEAQTIPNEMLNDTKNEDKAEEENSIDHKVGSISLDEFES